MRLLGAAVHTPIDDNTRLTIDDYRVHLYKVSTALRSCKNYLHSLFLHICSSARKWQPAAK